MVASFLFFILTSIAAAQSKSAVCPQGLIKANSTGDKVELKNCVHLKDIWIHREEIDNVSLNYARLSGWKSENLVLNKGSFVGAFIEYSYFMKLRGRFLDFRRSIWAGSSVKESDLPGANFSSAQVRGVRWYETDLSKATFRQAELTNCYFQKVILDEADLRGANFNNCIFIGVSFRRALFNKETVLPFTDAEKAQKGMVYQP